MLLISARKIIFAFFLLYGGITCAAFIPATKLFNYSEFNHIRMSPSGKYIVGYAAGHKKYGVIVFENSQAESTPLLVFSNTKKSGIRDIAWVDDDTLFLHYLSSNGLDKKLFYNVRMDGDKVAFEKHVIKAAGYIVDPMHDVENEVLYSKYKSDTKGNYIYRVNIDALKEDEDIASKYRVVKDVDKAHYFYTDERHSIRMVRENTESEKVYKYKNLKNNTWSLALKISEFKDVFVPVTFLPNNRVIALSNVGRDKVSVVEFDLERSSTVEVLYESPDFDITRAVLNRTDGSLQSVTVWDKGEPKTIFFSKAEDKLWRLLKKAFSSKSIMLVSGSLDNNHAVIFVSSSDSPGTYYYFNKKTLQVRPLSYKWSQLEEYHFSRSEKVVLKSEDGFKIEGYITRPSKKAKNYPLLVFVHGGPMGVRDTDLFNPEVQFFVNRGFGVLRVNYRGSAGYGKDFLQSGQAQWGQAIERDINLIVDHVKNNYSVNKDKLCIMGHSYGGYSALMSAILHPDTYKCAISSFGVSDISLMFSASNYAKDERVRESIELVLGNLPDDAEKLLKLSPVYQAGKLNIPVLLMAGVKDRVTYWENVNRMHFVLKKLNKEYEYVVYRDAYHGHTTWGGDRHQYIYMAAYLEEKLGVAQNWNKEDLKAYTKELNFAASEFLNVANLERLVKSDYQLGKKLFLRSHSLGNNIASYILASIYEAGVSGSKNNDKALEYYLIASERGNAKAHLKLGEIYMKGGLGKGKDLELARTYLERGLNSNDMKLKWNLANLYEQLNLKEKQIDLLTEISKSKSKFKVKAENKLESM